MAIQVRVFRPCPLDPTGYTLVGMPPSMRVLCQEGMDVLVLMIVLLVLWLILAVVGFAIKGLMWLAVIGIILFLGTAAIGVVRRKALHR